MEIKMNSKRGKLITQCLALLALWLQTSLVMATVQASLDRSKVYEGEAFTLTITSDGSQRAMPDLSLLENDFQILGSGSSQQMQVINGAVSSRTSWNIQLQAKGVGQFLIPSLRIGKDLTNPIQVFVSVPPEVSMDSDNQPVFVEVEIVPSEKPVYLQQQVIYTVRLFFQRPLLEGSLSSPAAEHAIVEQLSEDNQYSIKRGGKSYKVIERRYAVFPEKSGKFVLPPIRFSGRLASPPSQQRKPDFALPDIDPAMKRFFGSDPFGGNGFDRFFDRGKSVTLQSKAITIDVLPRSHSYASPNWLPAAELELVDSWADQPPEFKVGEPVSRTLSIKAKGVLATLLPELEIADAEGVSIYPEKPVTETHTDGTWVYGQSNLTISYMPTRAGSLDIPEMRLSWWDTESGVERTSVLPKWKLEILPGKDLPANDIASEADVQIVDSTGAGKQLDPSTLNNDDVSITEQERTWLNQIKEYWLLLLVLAMAVLLAMFWMRHRSMQKPADRIDNAGFAPEKSAVNLQTNRQLIQQLRKACSENNASSTADILLQMAALARPESPPQTLPALAAMLETGGEELRNLDRFLYATKSADWDGYAFYESFKKGLVFRVDEKPVHAGLAPLYPE